MKERQTPGKRSAAAGARQVVKKMSRLIGCERKRLKDSEDRTALHDFRVALRRTRTYLKAYRPVLRAGTELRDLRAYVKKCLQITTVARDREAVMERLEKLLPKLPPNARRNLKRASGELEEVQKRLGQRCKREVLAKKKRFQKLQLRKGRRKSGNFDAFTRAVLADQLGILKHRLKAIKSPAEQETAHPARIATKKARYLLALLPADGKIGSARPAAMLKGLQDLLGELRDLRLLRKLLEELWREKPQITESESRQLTMRTISKREEELSARFRKLWARGRGGARLGDLERSLHRAAGRD